MTRPMLIAQGTSGLTLHPRMANRHGLVAGATGTGKTVTLRVLAESFSANGIPVFMADVKGDLAGLCQPGTEQPRIRERVDLLKLEDFAFEGYPVDFWDLYGEQGHPVRTTISDMGPLLLSRLLGLNETQGGVLNLVFKVADDQGLLLLDLKDLQSMLQYAAEHAKELKTQYGNVSAASVGAIQRALLELEQQGGEVFFGEPALDLDDFLQTDAKGRGQIHILASERLIQAPKLYATFLLWLLSELFERLPEVGDPEKPRLVFFFDEAHLLFSDAPDALVDKIEQVVRLVRSKGVGVYFVSQNPLDIPEKVLGQLGNRVQHALRAFTPRDQKAVRAAAETFRSNPDLDVATAITELAVGEALVSFLDEKGIPGIVQRALVLPPRSALGVLSPETRRQVIQGSVLYGHYEKAVDRESAFEILKARTEQAQARSEEEPEGGQPSPRTPPEADPSRAPSRPPASRTDSTLVAFGKSIARAAGSAVGRQLVRGVLGSLFGGGKRSGSFW